MPMNLDPDPVRLRRVLRDLVALSALPAVWAERKPHAIAGGLADLLMESSQLDFAFVRLCDPNGGNAVESARGNAPPPLLEALQRPLADGGRLSRNEIVAGIAAGTQGSCGLVIPIGVNADAGIVAAACDRPDFSDEFDSLLLSVAANHAAAAFRMALLIDDHLRAEAALRDSERQLETKVAERTAELRRSETYLTEAQRLSHTGTWVFTPTNTVYWSEESYQIWGLDPVQGLPIKEAVWQRIHPDDRDRVDEETQEAVRRKRDYAGEFRILLPDGTLKYVEATGHHVFSASGALVEVVATHVDVTERKQRRMSIRDCANWRQISRT